MEGAARDSAALLAAGHDGGVEALAEAGGQVVDLVGAIDFDGLAGGIEGDHAVIAAAEMLLQLRSHLRRDRAVNEVVQQGKELSAGHFSAPIPSAAEGSFAAGCFRFFPLRKYLLRRSRSCNLALRSRDFTAGTLRPSASAVSSVESP